MKYSITVNQLAIIESGYNIDFIDSGILSAFLDTYSVAIVKKIYDGDKYVLFKHSFFIKQFPLIAKHTATERGLSKRLSKLESLGLIKKYKNNQKERTKFYTIGVNAHKILFNTEQKFQHYGTNVPYVENKCSDYNNIIDNKIINNNLEARKRNFFKLLLQKNNILSKPELKKFASYWSEHGDNDRKMRYEKEKSFNITRRLNTWNINNKNANTKGQGGAAQTKRAAI